MHAVKYKPHPYQVRAIAHSMRPTWALFLDMGLGKTSIALSAIVALQDRLEIKGVLIVAPLRVCEITWPAEVAKWAHTRGLRVSKVLGSPRARKLALSARADLYLINFENLQWLAEWMAGHPSAPFDMLIIDESSKFKSASSKRFRAMKPHLPRFARRGIMTGTPRPNTYEDLWAQIYTLDQGERLGKYVTHFRDRHFEADRWNPYKLNLRPGSAEYIEGQIADLTLVLKAADYLTMPRLIENIIPIDFPVECRKRYGELEREMITKLKGKTVEARNAADVSNKCRQLTSGAVYEPEIPGKARTWATFHAAKVQAIADVVEESAGDPVLVVYEFAHELVRLREVFPSAPYIGSGATAKAVAAAVEAWNRGELPVLLAHPASIGHGINLQAGGHIMAWTSLTWSLDLYLQTVARLYRQGQTKPVIVHILACRGTVDDDVAAAIKEKDKGQDAMLRRLIARGQ